MKPLVLNRNIQLWSYSPSFSRLLLLANKENYHADRIALVFQGTRLVQLPTHFYCHKVEAIKTNSEEINFQLVSTETTYSVIALRMDHTKDDFDFDEPIALYNNFFKTN